jgi:hypothetical protein
MEPAVRQSKRERIANLFAQNLGKRYESPTLHGMFGSSFRTRVSEINRDPSSPIRILKETVSLDDGETSVYWAELRKPEFQKPAVAPESLFDDLRPEPRYPD